MKKDPNWVLWIGIILLVLLVLNPGALFTFLGVIYYVVLIALGCVLILFVLKLLNKKD
jgi:hypothetical protein